MNFLHILNQYSLSCSFCISLEEGLPNCVSFRPKSNFFGCCLRDANDSWGVLLGLIHMTSSWSWNVLGNTPSHAVCGPFTLEQYTLVLLWTSCLPSQIDHSTSAFPYGHIWLYILIFSSLPHPSIHHASTHPAIQPSTHHPLLALWVSRLIKIQLKTLSFVRWLWGTTLPS